MKPLTTAFVFFLALSSQAQTTVAINSNSNFNSAVSSHCTSNCIVNIASGVTLTMNSGSCQTCTFNGGTVKVNASFSFWSPITFNNTNLTVTSDMTCQTCTFTNDTIHVTSAKLDLQSGTATVITGSHIVFSGTASSDAQNVTATNSVFAFSGTSSFSPSGSAFSADNSLFYFSNTSSLKPSTPATFKNNSILDMSGSASILATGSTFALQNSSMNMSGSASFISSGALSYTNSTMTMNNSASIANNNSITFTGSTLTQNNSASIASSGAFKADNSTLTLNTAASLASSSSFTIQNGSSVQLNGSSTLASSGTNTIQTNSGITIGDGSSTSTAKMTTGGSAVTVKDNSFITISNSNNSYVSTASTPSYTYTSSGGVNTTYSTANKTYNCGTPAYPNACDAKKMFGCATLNSGGALGCIVLAVADIHLTTTISSANKINLTWSDPTATTASEYQIQRSADNKEWTSLGTVIAGGYSTGDYHFTDDNAPAGTLNYRIARIDKDGKALYSAISTLTLTTISTAVRLYPNPATGHTFFIATPNTGELVVSLYTMTGQLLTQTQLKGQTQYALQLPAQVQAGSAVVVRAIGRSAAQTFTLLVR